MDVDFYLFFSSGSYCNFVTVKRVLRNVNIFVTISQPVYEIYVLLVDVIHATKSNYKLQLVLLSQTNL